MLNMNLAGYIVSSRTNQVGENQVTNLRVLHNGFENGKESTLGVDVAIWGKRAKYASDHGTKGNFFSGSGRCTKIEMATNQDGSQVNDKNGKPIMRIEMRADDFEICNRGGESTEGSGNSEGSNWSENSGGKAHSAASQYMRSNVASTDEPF